MSFKKIFCTQFWVSKIRMFSEMFLNNSCSSPAGEFIQTCGQTKDWSVPLSVLANFTQFFKNLGLLGVPVTSPLYSIIEWLALNWLKQIISLTSINEFLINSFIHWGKPPYLPVRYLHSVRGDSNDVKHELCCICQDHWPFPVVASGCSSLAVHLQFSGSPKGLWLI